MTRITLIAAMAHDRVIGQDGGIPWRVPGEQARFKATTLGHTLLMGRATFDSIGRALPGRRTIVLTRDPGWSHPDVETAHTFAEALTLAGPAGEVFVVGGAQVYALAMPFAHRMILTEVDVEVPGDTYFPAWSERDWRETAREPQDGWTIVTYERATG